jgi:hypothetical protein
VREGLKETLRDSKASDVCRKSVSALQDVALLLESKAPADADAFKTWLQHIAADAAEAANEGGFMGFGGVRVSEAEKATLSDLSSALGIKTASQSAGESPGQASGNRSERPAGKA